jgi:hypothetical protein
MRAVDPDNINICAREDAPGSSFGALQNDLWNAGIVVDGNSDVSSL